uniref:MOCS2B n=1 Tax=Chromera velia CCMP2878 TaxID=1169474 RepID=A0A0G4GAE6_9ALVE|mmetsp:Transcript_20253/g.40575  ORF Transcript_20253/g.40575 Transcript_20253/m.40575 type:complete len:193 (-) Transcript_20253:143-721(-)|eukprot:Cvel_20982.t1-p1 / transcript=Cvel_20982.t1 / gene=Cvel_20982 / organism=Chromera_velia_CCMP2878 / gene_product=Molybdopterin synthase catalytic subunit, putative / transcript_product=Molybdopterin synthase catalytic subunit, putative / location=Cvel_scaffold1931:6414-9161(-) / protein_length=192 / sequence_SO=supercontig / SO=protein_coding / is_pseudo=false
METAVSAPKDKEGGQAEPSPVHVKLIHGKLSLASIIDFVEDPVCGGVATFSGTTRNHAHGKKVVQLTYEAYEPMAVKKMQEVITIAQKRWTEIRKVAVEHRLGDCPVGESGVNVAVSSPHRKDCLEACQFIINELKAQVPIWKKEVYEDGSVWKENAEWRDTLKTKQKQGCGCRPADPQSASANGIGAQNGH